MSPCKVEKMNIIDTHIHYMPEVIPGEAIIKNMDECGISRSIVLSVPDHPRYEQMRLTGTNTAVEELCRKFPDRLIPALYAEPRNVMEVQTRIRRFHDRGGRILKMWPGHGWAPDDPMIYPVWEVINELKMAVILHMGMLGVRSWQLPIEVCRSTGFNAKYGQPVLLDAPARCFPDIQFVIAHTAYPWTLEALEMVFMFKNIWMDFSCGLGYEAWNLIEKLRPGRLAWERFLFGSDTAGTARDFVSRWNEISQHELFAPHAEDFFHKNAENLLSKAGLDL